jgi:hypothetical protein
MAKITGPLLSLGAGGSIAKTQVYSKWRGVPYVRQHVIPANPDTTDQQLTRNIFSTMNVMWKISPAGVQAPWLLYATGQPFVGRNAWLAKNVKQLYNKASPLVSMATMIGSPGAKGGTPPDSVVAASGGAGLITVTFTDGVAPTGWTLTAHQAFAFIDQAPDDLFASVVTFAEETSTPPVAVAFTGLAAGDYVVCAWNKWLKADGVSPAYSASLNDTITVA